MKPDLKELVKELKKYNPTFTDTDIRSYLINMGNAPEAVDAIFKTPQAQVVVPAPVKVAESPVFENTFVQTGVPNTPPQSKNFHFLEDGGLGGPKVSISPVLNEPAPVVAPGPFDPGEVKFFNEKVIGQRPMTPSGQIIIPKKSKAPMIAFIIILFIVLAGVGYLFYAGILKSSSITGNKVFIDIQKKIGDLISNFKDPNENVPMVEDNQLQNTGTTTDTVIPTTTDENAMVKDTTMAHVDLLNQIESVNKVRTALNIYTTLYGEYPESLGALNEGVPQNSKATLVIPELREEDLTDKYTGREFIYKKDAKTGFSLTYVIDIPEKLLETDVLYSILDYKVAYNTQLKRYLSTPVVKYVNGTNTGTRDAISLEALSQKITDLNKNLIPDMFEDIPPQVVPTTTPVKK